MAKINDFGEKIGGAKKDIWKERGISVEDLLEMNEAEKVKYVKKDNIWKKPNYQTLSDSGIPIRVVYFIKLIRDALPTRPVVDSNMNNEECMKYVEGYVEFVGKIRDYVMKFTTEDEVLGFYSNFLDDYIKRLPGTRYVTIKPDAYNCISNKLLKAGNVRNFYKIDNDIKRKQFCFSEEERNLSGFEFILYDPKCITFEIDHNEKPLMVIKKSYTCSFYNLSKEYESKESWKENTYFVIHNYKIVGRNFESLEEAKDSILKVTSCLSTKKISKRKKSFVPPQLEFVERNGKDYRHNRNIDNTKWQKEFAFRGVEFGNWMSQSDRQISMNYCYDAFKDLAILLDIEDQDIAFGGTLAIAFGARGSSRAIAHYEPLYKVINLTKMRGAGSTAHEWMHALDHSLSIRFGLDNMKLASECSESKMKCSDIPNSFYKLIKALKYNEHGEYTDYYLNTVDFSSFFSKEAHGYWTSNCEMLARAFACYVKDKLDGKSDYLVAHAESYVYIHKDKDGNEKSFYAIPCGEERKKIYLLFDQFFLDLKKIEYFHKRKLIKEDIVNQEDMNAIPFELPGSRIESSGQYAFCL